MMTPGRLKYVGVAFGCISAVVSVDGTAAASVGGWCSGSAVVSPSVSRCVCGWLMPLMMLCWCVHKLWCGVRVVVLQL